ncbi:TOBE domain-containing protein [Mesorhizobium sp. WSM3859]|uniref:TOBE domain-containing protein n=1 Tax=Mesorhizobium sp. WSM3859 TaxID=2029402 RepID=UPI001FE19C63|nr:TOBE domain-containing protein [Mesorhizobium sp. WSM3859]
MHFLAAEHLETVGGTARVRLADGSIVKGVKAPHKLERGQKARLMVRPEAFRLRPAEGNASLTVEILDTAFFGDRRRVVARTGSGDEIDARPTSDTAEASSVDAGYGRQIFFDPTAAFLFPA